MSPGADEEALARLALCWLVEPGTWSVYRAVRRLGAEQVWEALCSGAAPSGVPPQVVEAAHVRAQGHDPRRDLDALHRSGGRLLVPGDAGWPQDGLDWPDGPRYAPPLALQVAGAVDLRVVAAPVDADPGVGAVAVVGARAATAYGAAVARELGCGLAERGLAVVSGGAYGIDAAAHTGALASGGAPTVAVLASGLDQLYPPGNARLLARVAEQGLLVTEVVPGTTPTRARFLVRNRLIAALTAGTVVVEAALRSGSLSTVGRAQELSRHVMAVPGPVTSAASAGCHQLLRDGAVCVTGPEEVVEVVGAAGATALTRRRGPERPRDRLSEAACAVLDAVPARGGAGEAALARGAGVPALVVQQVLPPLLVAGLVERCDEGWRLTALGAGRPAPR